jgi:hypothetical protein
LAVARGQNQAPARSGKAGRNRTVARIAHPMFMPKGRRPFQANRPREQEPLRIFR